MRRLGGAETLLAARAAVLILFPRSQCSARPRGMRRCVCARVRVSWCSQIQGMKKA